MKYIIPLMLLLLTSCTVVRPVDTSVTVVGNPVSFHTEFAAGNNSVNVTIIQEPSRLIYYPIDYELMGKTPQFELKCYDDYGDYKFSQNLSFIWYTGEYRESHPDDMTLIQFPELMHNQVFDMKDLNQTFKNYNCRINSEFKTRYMKYVDGVLVENTTDSCDYFWYDWGNSIKIFCDHNSCEYTRIEDRSLETFLMQSSLYIMDNCFRDWTRVV